jgi:hypothetical protein
VFSNKNKSKSNQKMSEQQSPTTRKPATAAASKVHLYAEFLGIDLKKHPYLYDLMEEGLRCPLPEGWKLRTLEPDEDGNPCHDFFHEASGKVSNAHPMDEVFFERARSVIKKHEAAVAARKEKETGTSQLSTSMWNDSMSDNDNADGEKVKKTVAAGSMNLSSVRTYRNKEGNAKSGKQFRYLLYCVVIASVIHFITYQAVYKIVFEMGNPSSAAAAAGSRQKQAVKKESEMKEEN